MRENAEGGVDIRVGKQEWSRSVEDDNQAIVAAGSSATNEINLLRSGKPATMRCSEPEADRNPGIR